MALILAHPQCNATAHRLLSQASVLPSNFPNPRQINRFEGLRGPDLAWFRGRSDSYDAYHYYNPATGQGQAPIRATWHWRRLAAALQGRPAGSAPIGYHAAWCAHFAVDALSPAHHLGHYHNPGSIKDNWRDPFGDDAPLWSLHNHHTRFEWAAWKATRRGVTLPKALPETPKGDRIVEWLQRLATQIYERHLFERYVALGWSPAIEHAFRQRVWPLTIATVAILWQTACR